MKKFYILVVLIFISYFANAQNEANNLNFRAGIKLSSIIVGEIGLNLELYKENKALIFAMEYKTDLDGNLPTDYDFNKATHGFLASYGPTFRLGYKMSSNNTFEQSSFFVLPELIFRQAGYDHTTFYRKSDNDYLEQVESMCSKRYGGGIKLGVNKYFRSSKVYWELNMGLGILYYKDKKVLHSSKNYSDTPLQQLYTDEGSMLTYSLNFIIGFDFNN